MLQPANRLTLIDALRPPAGFRLESAMAVTYTLNLSALLAVPAAFALSGAASRSAGREDGPVEPGSNDGRTPGSADDGAPGTAGGDPIRGRDRLESVELIHALRSHADRLTVFSQAGEIALPPSRKVFTFLERTVVPVTAPRGGIVHPKVWVIRYQSANERPDEPADGHGPEQRLRVLVSSRNLGFDESWDTLVRLDEIAGTGGVRLKPMGRLFRALLDNAVYGDSHDHRQRVKSLSKALKTARFALPEGVDELHVHVLGLKGALVSPLPNVAKRSLIISPFVSDDFFTKVQPGRIDELVSRREWLDRLDCSSLSNVAAAYTFDDGSVPEVEAQTDRLSPLDPGRPLVGLHAKVFAFEDAGRARLFLGSANATGPAFTHSIEILLELVGPKRVLGIDRLCEGTGEEPDPPGQERREPGEERRARREEPGLRDFFIPYVRTVDRNEDGETSSLDGLRRDIARLRITGRVEARPRCRDIASHTDPSEGGPATKLGTHPSESSPVARYDAHPSEGGHSAAERLAQEDPDSDDAAPLGGRPDANGDGWSVIYRSELPLPVKEGVAIHCWPLATAGHRRPVTGGEPLEERFETSLENLSGFIAFELASEDEDNNVSRFVVPVLLEGVPVHRERRLLTDLIGNAERFFRYLLALLNEDTGEAGFLEAIQPDDDEALDDGSSRVSLPVLEKLLRTMRRDPARLFGLHPLVSDLAAEDALPPRFAELWKTIHDVAKTEAATR